MSKRRRSRLCTGCRKATTYSLTNLCIRCRPADAIPKVHRDRDVITFAGLSFSEKQAIQLANDIIDTIERATNAETE
jgi:hypothetical protein